MIQTRIAVLILNASRDLVLRKSRVVLELVVQARTIAPFGLLPIHFFSRVTTDLRQGIFLWVFVKEVRDSIAATVITSACSDLTHIICCVCSFSSDCDTDAECGPGLVCMQRSGDEAVPGCTGESTFGEDYCYDPNGNAPTTPPGPQPTYAPNTFGATFVPGDLSQPCDGGKLMLSRGMDCRLLTTAGQYVQYDTGGQSTVPMHRRADGAAVIAHPTDGGWYYTSNSERKLGGGGVGTLRFNA